MREWLDADPLTIVAGEGRYLIDEQGRRYLDGVSSLWCNITAPSGARGAIRDS
jgi:adenosylmethionine-8-amino-7-oxononanoate aminotransferase